MDNHSKTNNCKHSSINNTNRTVTLIIIQILTLETIHLTKMHISILNKIAMARLWQIISTKIKLKIRWA